MAEASESANTEQGVEDYPANEDNSSAKRKFRAKVAFSYHPENEDELNLEVDDIVDVVGQPEDGWWEGVVRGHKGVFPSNFVTLLEEDNNSMDGTNGKANKTDGLSPPGESDTQVEAVVEYDYDSDSSDEMSLKEGEIITNINILDEGWWEGELNGKRGMFPSNYVKVIKEDKPGKKSSAKSSKVPAPPVNGDSAIIQSSQSGGSGGSEDTQVVKRDAVKERNPDLLTLTATMPTSVQGENINMGSNQTVVGGDNVGGNQTRIEKQFVINVGGGAEKGGYLEKQKNRITEAIESANAEQGVEDYPANKDSKFNLESVRQQLMQEYKHTRGTLPLLPGVPEEFATMEDLFVSLEIVEEDKKPSGILTKKLRSCGELVCIKRKKGKKNEVEKVKRLLVRGHPGTGKSSTVSKLAYDWACNKQDSPTSQYQLLFAITINEIDIDTDLIGIIKDQLLPEVSGEALRVYIQSHASLICLILDGYDEATEHFLQCRDVKNVLCSRWLAEACVLVTTRVNEVGRFCQSYGTYTQVEITGFSKKGRRTYVDKFFMVIDDVDKLIMVQDDVDRRHRCCTFRESLGRFLAICTKDDGGGEDDDDDDDNDSDNDENNVEDGDDDVSGDGPCRNFFKSLRRCQLYQLSTIPIILSMLCLLWMKDAAFPSSFTALYKKVSLHLANHAAAKRKTDDKAVDWVNRILFHVGKVAIQGLFKDKLNFKATDFQCDLLEEAFLLGVVTKERKRSRQGVTYSVTFLHKTFQEFCAAFYWVHLVDTDRKTFDQHLQQIRESNVFEMDYLLRFACGLSVKAAEIILPHVVQIMCQHKELKNKDGKICDLHVNVCQQIPLFLLHEAESNDSNVKESYILHSLLKPLFSTIVLKFEARANSEFHRLLLSYLSPLKANAGIVTQFHRPWLADVEHVEFRYSPKAGNAILNGFAQIAKMIDQHNGGRLQNSAGKMLSQQDEMSSDGQGNGSDVQVGLNIEYLELIGSDIGESVENLAQAYKYMPRLRHLDLFSTRLKPSHCAALFDAFITAGKMLLQQEEMSSDTQGNGSDVQVGLCIEYLNLHFNTIGESFDKLLQALQFMPHLTYINVGYECGLDEKSLQCLHEVLMKINDKFTKISTGWWDLS